MTKINKTATLTETTHEGAPVKRITKEAELKRAVCSCMLWENQAYESGVSIADRIKELIPLVDSHKVGELAYEARTSYKLRHIPLFLIRELARTGFSGTSKCLESVIQRPDELTEFLAMYWQEGRQPLSAQVKKGLAAAFKKFSAYQLAKYNQDNTIKLRDVMFLCHPKPINEEQAKVWKDLVDGNLASPDTWEVNLSAGKDKKETWKRLLSENKLGGLALLRNLRNMEAAKVDKRLIKKAILNMNTDRVLPYRFIAAAKYGPAFEAELETAMLKSMEGSEKLSGKTILLVDVSGSMNRSLSSKSELLRMDAASGLAIILRELCEDVEVYTFSRNNVLVPARRGFALRDAVVSSQDHRDTYLGKAVSHANEEGYDRLVVITDEQSDDPVPNPINDRGYMINVASYKNGVGYGAWNHIDGFSEAVVNWIIQFEKI